MSNTISKEQAKVILSLNFCPTDFVYDDNVSPLDNIANAIEMYGDMRREYGESVGFDYGYAVGSD